jgi:hypothetical protein
MEISSLRDFTIDQTRLALSGRMGTGLWNVLGQLCGYQHLLGPRFGMRCDQGGRRADRIFQAGERTEQIMLRGAVNGSLYLFHSALVFQLISHLRGIINPDDDDRASSGELRTTCNLEQPHFLRTIHTIP